MSVQEESEKEKKTSLIMQRKSNAIFSARAEKKKTIRSDADDLFMPIYFFLQIYTLFIMTNISRKFQKKMFYPLNAANNA